MQAFTNNIPLGQEETYRQVLLNLQPLMQDDSTNPVLQESIALAYVCRHLDKDRENQGKTRISGPDAFLKWHDLETIRGALPKSIATLDPWILACLIIFNNKGRFECQVRAEEKYRGHYRPVLYIKATQGHTTEYDPMVLHGVSLTPQDIRLVTPCVHCTLTRHFEDDIKISGLRPGGK